MYLKIDGIEQPVSNQITKMFTATKDKSADLEEGRDLSTCVIMLVRTGLYVKGQSHKS